MDQVPMTKEGFETLVKELKTLTGLGLKESMALVNDLPAIIKESVSTEEANSLKDELENLGAEIELK